MTPQSGPRRPLTTLQVARRIADAVLCASASRPEASVPAVPSHEHAPTQAVMNLLRDLDLWFCAHQSDP